MAESTNEMWERLHKAEYRQTQKGREERMIELLEQILECLENKRA